MDRAKKKGGAAATAPTLNFARYGSKAAFQYSVPTISSIDLAARIIGARFRLSTSVAGTVVELAGYGRRA